jgi:hypothetical protein
MKKALVVLLILAVAGGAFAEVNFTGEVKTGLGLVYDTLNETAYLEAYNRDAEQAFQFRLNGAVANEGDTAGLKFRLQQRFSGFSIPYAFGYLNAFSNLLTFQGGLIDDGTFNSGGGILDADAGEGVGTNILVRPIANLVIGAGAYAASGFAIPTTAGTGTAGTGYAKTGDAKYTAGLSFTAPNVVKFVTSFRTKNKLTAPTDGGSHNQLIAGINILALSDLGLKLVLEGRFTDIGEDNEVDPMDVDGFVTVGYTKDALSLGLNFALYKVGVNKPSGSTISDDPVLAFWLYGSYAVTESIVPRLDVAFVLNDYADGYKTNGGDQMTWHHKAFTASKGSGSPATGGNKDQKLIAFKPAVLLKIDANNTLEIGDYVGVHLDANKVFGDKDTLITNAFYIDYVFKF